MPQDSHRRVGRSPKRGRGRRRHHLSNPCSWDRRRHCRFCRCPGHLAAIAVAIAIAVAAFVAKELAEQTAVSAVAGGTTVARASVGATRIAHTAAGIFAAGVTNPAAGISQHGSQPHSGSHRFAARGLAADIAAATDVTAFTIRSGHNLVVKAALDRRPWSTLRSQKPAPLSAWAHYAAGGAAGGRQTEYGNDTQELFHQKSPLNARPFVVLECRREPNLSHRSGQRTDGAPWGTTS